MGNILSNLISITLYPFTSGTYFVVVPCILCSVTATFGLIRRLMKGDFDGLNH